MLTLDALCRRHALTSTAATALAALLETVAGDPEAPTTVRDRDGILRDHLADSLVALELTEVRSSSRIADLGSGAGFPGLPLAIALADAHVALVESNGRKCEFMQRAIAACGIGNARPVHTRAEAWADGVGCCDLVTTRAVDSLSVVTEYAAPLLALGGVFVAWRGRRDAGDEYAAARAADLLGLRPGAVVRVQPYPGAQHRHLHVFTKVSPTPDRFPRRPGVAHKRPLGTASDRLPR
ncbi:MAG: 16S rRNA (guanine(527)-N(7))-methyltransferase RsmG [Solirubrobacteraceae bacterium]